MVDDQFVIEREPAAAEEHQTDDDSAAIDLHTSLVEIFDVPDTPDAPSFEEPTQEESSECDKFDPTAGLDRPSEPTIETPQELETSEVAVPNYGSSSMPQANPEPEPQPEPKPAAGNSTLEDAEDENSVAAYMSQLIARTQKGRGDEGFDDLAYTAPKPTPAAVATPAESSAQSEYQSVSDSVNSNEPVADEEELLNQAPTHQIDRDAMRADMMSMREVANMSARTALNTHESKQLKESINIKFILTIVSGGLSAAFFTASRLTRFSFDMYGWMTTSVTAVLLCEIIRSSFKVSRLSKADVVADIQERLAQAGELEGDPEQFSIAPTTDADSIERELNASEASFDTDPSLPLDDLEDLMQQNIRDREFDSAEINQ